MSEKISPFPKLNDEQRLLLFEEQDFSMENYGFSYITNNEGRHLDLKEIDTNVYSLVDQRKDWHPEKNDIHVTLNFALKNCNVLFGKDGIACDNACIGLALVWTSSSSRQRGSRIIGDVKNVVGQLHNYHSEFSFAQGQMRGIIRFQVILFLKKTGTPSPMESHLANIVGSRLGVLHEFFIMLDSKGSDLPLYEVYEPNNKLLWYVRKYWDDDPLTASFIDSFSIHLNKNHKNYPLLKNLESKEMSPLLIEMMSSVYTSLILELQRGNDWDRIVKGENLEEGSLAAAIYYFIKTFDIDTDSPISISESVRNHLSMGA